MPRCQKVCVAFCTHRQSQNRNLPSFSRNIPYRFCTVLLYCISARTYYSSIFAKSAFVNVKNKKLFAIPWLSWSELNTKILWFEALGCKGLTERLWEFDKSSTHFHYHLAMFYFEVPCGLLVENLWRKWFFIPYYCTDFVAFLYRPSSPETPPKKKKTKRFGRPCQLWANLIMIPEKPFIIIYPRYLHELVNSSP